jgi:hypothetical protein
LAREARPVRNTHIGFRRASLAVGKQRAQHTFRQNNWLSGGLWLSLWQGKVCFSRHWKFGVYQELNCLLSDKAAVFWRRLEPLDTAAQKQTCVGRRPRAVCACYIPVPVLVQVLVLVQYWY